MDLIIYPGKLQGTVNAIPSKSQAHRLLICSAFSNKPTMLVCAESNQWQGEQSERVYRRRFGHLYFV